MSEKLQSNHKSLKKVSRHSSSYKESYDKMIHLLVKHLVMYDEYLYLSVDGWCQEKGKEHITYSISFLQIQIW